MDFCLQGLVAICESAQHVSVGLAPITSDVCMTGMALLWDALLFFAMIRGFLGSWIGRNHPQTMRYSVFGTTGSGGRDGVLPLSWRGVPGRQAGRRKGAVGCACNIFPAYVLWEV